MYARDQPLPRHRAAIAIRDLALLAGQLSPTALSLVREWARLHQAELLDDWALARADAEARPILPLE